MCIYNSLRIILKVNIDVSPECILEPENALKVQH